MINPPVGERELGVRFPVVRFLFFSCFFFPETKNSILFALFIMNDKKVMKMHSFLGDIRKKGLFLTNVA